MLSAQRIFSEHLRIYLVGTLEFYRQKPGKEWYTSITVGTIGYLADSFSADILGFLPLLAKFCRSSDLSKTIAFLVVLQMWMLKSPVNASSAIFGPCFSFLKAEWQSLGLAGHLLAGEELLSLLLEEDCRWLLDQLHDNTDIAKLNVKILVCAFWRLIKAFIQTKPASLENAGDWMCTLNELYYFFAGCNMKYAFKKHRHHIVRASFTPVHFLMKFVHEGASCGVQVESLHSLTTSAEPVGDQPVAEISSVLVPLSDESKDVRVAAMNYLEMLWRRVKSAGMITGDIGSWCPVIEKLIQQKKLVLADMNFLPSFLTNVLSKLSQNHSVPANFQPSLDKSDAEDVLSSMLGQALKCPARGKLKILSLLKGVGEAVIQVKGVESLLLDLLKQRSSYHFGFDKSCPKLSRTDVDIMCLLVEMCFMAPASDVCRLENPLFMALQVDDISLDEPAVIEPCFTLLNKLSNQFFGRLKIEKKERLLQELVLLCHHANSDIQNAAREALLRLSINSPLLSKLLDDAIRGVSGKKKKSMKEPPFAIPRGEDAYRFLSSLLDLMLMKKDIPDRANLVNPLFGFIGQTLSKKLDKNSVSGITQTMSIQHTVFLILEDIITSFSNASDSSLKGALAECELSLLVECAGCVTDGPTHNHIFSVFTAISKVMPDKIVNLIPEMLAIVCRSSISQSGGHSRKVYEDFISVIVPCWLSNTKEAVTLLQVFVDVMPEVSVHQRLSIVMTVLRAVGESTGLGLLLVLLLRSLASRKGSVIDDKMLQLSNPLASVAREWEYTLAIQICEQYSYTVWLPSLVIMLRELHSGKNCHELYVELMLKIRFISDKLCNPELLYKLQLSKDVEIVQRTLGDLMEQVVCSLQLVDTITIKKKKKASVSIKKGLKELIHNVFSSISILMPPSSFFDGISRLLCHNDKSLKKKALQLLCDTMKHLSAANIRKERILDALQESSWIHLDDCALNCFGTLCKKILQLVDQAVDDQDVSVILIAFSAIEILTDKIPSDQSIFGNCLTSAVKHSSSEDLSVSSACLRTTGALVKVLGPRALPELPRIMECVLKRSNMYTSLKLTIKEADRNCGQTIMDERVLMSVLGTLEAVIETLGSFLSPYLVDILEALILHPYYIFQTSQRLKSKADTIRRLLTAKVPVRLAIPPLLTTYRKAVNSGDTSLSILFEMIANFIKTMDRSSISTFHGKIFDLSLLALDLRCLSPPTIKNVSMVEKHVIDATILLTLKLTETTFKPLFIRTVEWSESNVEQADCVESMKVKRAISFYGLVNCLADRIRDHFVPYYKYLVEGCIRYLTDHDDKGTGHSRKKKKAKQEGVEGCEFISLERWQLRSLVLSALHKCFLYDAGKLKFLDSTNFQLLLKPIVSQLGVEPPALLKECPDIASTEDVDDLIISCVGQMAVTCGSDLLWKPLNHEVLMQTRSEMLRSRVLGLRIVKYLVQHLKEEYLVLLAETIPFLAELLEDVELPVQSLAQEILKELEAMSGENLRNYF